MSERLVAWGAARLVWVLGATLRLQVSGIERVLPYWQRQRPLIYVVWHGRMLLAPWLSTRLAHTRGARRVSVLASRSRDGERVARYVTRFGLGAVRGSSSRGGAAGLRALVAAVRGGEDVALVPDGPRGPSGRLQPGVVVLAALTGAPVVPFAVAARPAHRLGSWDTLLVPLPFARCALVLGEPLSVERGADRARAGTEIARALDETTAAADRLVAS